MYPDSPYAHPIGSFRVPVVPPTTEPNEDPLVAVCVNDQWLPFLIGATKQLLLESTWQTSEAMPLDLIQQRVYTLIGQLQGDQCPFIYSYPNWRVGGGAPIGLDGGLAEWHYWVGVNHEVAFVDYAGYIRNMEIKFWDVDSHNQVGGLVEQCELSCRSGEIETINVTATDCNNVSQNLSGGSYLNVLNPYGNQPHELKDLIIATSNWFFFRLVISGNWTCGEV